MNFVISNTSFHKDSYLDDGNKFLIGNGYMGVRGTLDEYRKDKFPSVNLAGIYDKVSDSWREPLNAPNPFYTYIEVDTNKCFPSEETPFNHKQELNFRHGIFSRKTSWKNEKGLIHFKSERFVSMNNCHIYGCKFSAFSNYDCNLSIYTGIDKDVWDINGPHYTKISFKDIDNLVLCNAYAGNSHKTVIVTRKDFFLNEACEFNDGIKKFNLHLKAFEEVTLTYLGAIFTSNDSLNPEDEAINITCGFNENSYEIEKKKSIDVWEELWDICEVNIDGDEKANISMNYSLYHLNSIAPRHKDNLSIPARGLSGQVYKGAIFWDSEMFMLDYYLYTNPKVAKSLIEYRIESLPLAILKAKEYGHSGAFYPWESQEGGIEACTYYNVIDVFTKRPQRTYFRDKQYHISSAIVYGIMKYINHTLDYDILINGGAETIIECAKFYLSLLLKPFYKDKYEILDVVGPDEYHERVNNNAYTNKMAKYTFKSALECIEILKNYSPKLYENKKLNELIKDFTTAYEKIYIPCPDDNGIIEQFDGYFKLEDVSLDNLKSRLIDPREYWGGAYGIASQTKIIKQADVVTMLEIFHDEYDENILKNNFNYYETRTEHGSSLSACMHGLLACRFNEPNIAYPFFLKSAETEIKGKGKKWAGLIYIGGTHPAASGGAYKVLVQGFAGLYFKDGKPKIKPCLPENWNGLYFKFLYNNKKYQVSITKNHSKIEEIYHG